MFAFSSRLPLVVRPLLAAALVACLVPALRAEETAPTHLVVQDLYRRYEIRGLPAIVFLDREGDELTELRLSGYERPLDFAARLRCVGAQQHARLDS